MAPCHAIEYNYRRGMFLALFSDFTYISAPAIHTCRRKCSIIFDTCDTFWCHVFHSLITACSTVGWLRWIMTFQIRFNSEKKIFLLSLSEAFCFTASYLTTMAQCGHFQCVRVCVWWANFCHFLAKGLYFHLVETRTISTTDHFKALLKVLSNLLNPLYG